MASLIGMLIIAGGILIAEFILWLLREVGYTMRTWRTRKAVRLWQGHVR
jgi:hypothetical protein